MSDVAEKPLVTFALFAYNQERYIREAVEAALAQDYPNLEIIISDDCSGDGTWGVICEAVESYVGPHCLITNRNERNVGLASHINTVLGMVSGDFVVVAAGDDISSSDRVSVLVDAWVKSGRKKISMFSASEDIDQDGRVTGVVARSKIAWGKISAKNMISRGVCIYGSSQAWSVEMMRSFPPLNRRVINEDNVMALRSVLSDGVIYIPDVLVKYRVGQGLASDYGKAASIGHRFAPSILYRPYLVAVQKHGDIRAVGRSDLIDTVKGRRADDLLRYWLISGRPLTRRKIVFFIKRARLIFFLRWCLIYLREKFANFLRFRFAGDVA